MGVAVAKADHDEVSAAVTAAERRTDGEIVTVIADCSDPYHDVALAWSVLAAFAVPAVLAVLPQDWIDAASGLLLGWNAQWSRLGLMVTILMLLALAFLLVRALLLYRPLLHALTPGGIKTRRTRRRAIAHFRSSCERKTRGRTGILIYLSLAEHRAEIVADEAINDVVDGDVWGEAMEALIEEVREGRIGRGMARAVEKVGGVLAQHLPRSRDDTNELPDRLIHL